MGKFKLGKQTRKVNTPSNSPIIRKKLGDGILAEANKDGSIFVDKSVKPGSSLEKKVIAHEKKHLDEMKQGKIGYTKTTTFDKIAGVKFKRVDGDLVVVESTNPKYPVGMRAPEGSNKWAHEQRAIKEEKKA